MSSENNGLMNTQCTGEQLEFHALGRRAVIGKFDGGRITSDGGGVLLREVEQRLHILKRFSDCFTGGVADQTAGVWNCFGLRRSQ